LLEDRSDPLEDGVRGRIRAFIEEELGAAHGRGRHGRSDQSLRGWRNGHRQRQGIGTFGPEPVRVPRARMTREGGGTTEWRSRGLRRHQRLTRRAEALIAGACLAGGRTRAASSAPWPRPSRAPWEVRRQPGMAQDEDRLAGPERVRP
jgi:transposase-like protein